MYKRIKGTVKTSLFIFVALIMLFFYVQVILADSFLTWVEPNVIATTGAEGLNFSVNNTGSQNITQVNITLPAGFVFDDGTNFTTAPNTDFSNTSSVMTWTNTTSSGFIPLGLTYIFSIDVFAPNAANGTAYNFTVTTYDTNSTSNSSNVSVTIIDTTPANATLNSPSDGEQYSKTQTFNCSASDPSGLSNISIEIYDQIGGLVYSNTTPLSGTSNSTTWTTTLNTGTYDWSCYALDVPDNMDPNWFQNNRTLVVVVGDLFGYVINSTGQFVENANVSIWKQTSQPGQPPVETLIKSNTTDSNGFFSFHDVNISGMGSMFYLRAISYSGSGNATEVSPILPPLPSDMVFGASPYRPFGPPVSMNNSTTYLQSAGTIRLSAVNASGSSINFGYMVIDQKIGFTIKSCVHCNISGSVDVAVPRDRNYTVMLARDPQIFPGGPQCDDWTILPTECPAPPISNSSIYPTSFLSANDYVLELQTNISFTSYNLSGYVDIIGNTTPIEFVKVMPKLVPWPGFVPPMGAELEAFNASEHLNATKAAQAGKVGYFNIPVMGSGAGINYLVEFYGNGTNEYFAAFQNFTITGNKQYNITLRKLAGSYTTMPPDGHINTSKTRINIVNSTGQLIQATVHVEVEVRNDNIYNGEPVYYILEEREQVNGSFWMPFLNDSNVKVMIFSQDQAPRMKKLVLTNPEINITLKQFEMRGFDGTNPVEFNTSMKQFIDVKFYKSNSTCNVFNPPADCLIAAFKGDFNPLQAMMAGKTNIMLNILTSNVTLYFINVDLMASGPPDADMSDVAISSSVTSTTFVEAWRFGSLAPDVYDYVLIGIPYSEGSVNESWSYNISIPYFYDENWNSVWTTVDGIGNLPYDYSEYNINDYDDYLTALGMVCSKTDSNSICYMNTTGNKIWMKIPHFSGIQPTINGIAPPTGGFIPGGGSGDAPIYLVNRKKGNINITITSLDAGEKQSVAILRTEDMSFRRVIVYAKNALNNIKIMVTKLEGLPASVTRDISGEVYHYIDVTIENFTDPDLDNATIEFAIPKSWLDDNNIDKSNITLYRWQNHNWNALPTTQISETSTEVFYSAVTSGFSYFVIGTIEIITAAPTTCTENWICTDWSVCVDGKETRTCTDLHDCGTEANKPETSRDCILEQILVGAEDLGLGGILVASGIILAIVVIILLLVKGKKIDLSFLKQKKKFKYKYKHKRK